MKISRLLIIAIVIVVIIVVAVVAFMVLQSPGPPCTSSWSCGASYPIQVSGTTAIAGQQCVNNSTVIVCIGGQDANGGPRDEVYLATLSSSGNISGWTLEANQYPRVINGQSCVLSGGYVYCVGGSIDSSPDDTNASYFAPFSASGGVGTWGTTTGFPIAADSQSCVAAYSYIYCVGGYNETDGQAADAVTSSSVWYAPLSSSGIGTWVKTNPYPTDFFLPTCVTAGGYIYCMGGVDENGNSVGAAYIAQISSSGVGSWTSVAAYPLPASGLACVLVSTTITCVGGVTAGGSSPTFTNAVYYATVSPSSISAWKSGPDYPVAVSTDCVASTTMMYCVGGFDGSAVGENSAVKYASLTQFASA